jgi:hypothetical protein
MLVVNTGKESVIDPPILSDLPGPLPQAFKTPYHSWWQAVNATDL